MTTSQDRFLYYLSVWKIFQRTLSLTLSRGVPLDCGCKGRTNFTFQPNITTTFFERKFKKNCNKLIFNSNIKNQNLDVLWELPFLCCKTCFSGKKYIQASMLPLPPLRHINPHQYKYCAEKGDVSDGFAQYRHRASKRHQRLGVHIVGSTHGAELFQHEIP